VPRNVYFLMGDSTKRGAWQKGVAEHEVVINLAGASIFRRWTARNKRLIRESRVLTKRHVVEALAGCKGRNSHLFSASGIGIYGSCGDEEINENSSIGDNFIAQVAVQWEREALAAERFGTRVVLCRFSQVMGIRRRTPG
jgi:NAD dependent epimerase/dehydratase family enzyme